MSKSSKSSSKSRSGSSGAKANTAVKQTKNAPAPGKSMPEMVRLTVTLLAISAACALCLGLVNAITAPRIAAAQEARTNAAMAEVLPADAYTPVDFLSRGSVTAIYQADDKGYVVQVSASGFGGAINMMVGVDNNGNCTGVSIISMSETAGLGANASKEDFRAQFVGQSGTVAVTKDGGAIDSLTGATITSRAVADGVTEALEIIGTLG